MSDAEDTANRTDTMLAYIVCMIIVLIGLIVIASVAFKSVQNAGFDWSRVGGFMIGSAMLLGGVSWAAVVFIQNFRATLSKPILDSLEQIATALNQLETKITEDVDEVGNMIAEVDDAVRMMEVKIQTRQQPSFHWFRCNH
jgi:hypothetical protein